MSNSFNNYSLFTDVEDLELRAYNRGQVMANIIEDHLFEDTRISKQGTLLIVGYFNKVDDAERKDALTQFQKEVKKRGYKYGDA